jgi:hypothetical protein
VKAIYFRVREYETGIIWGSGDMNEPLDGISHGAMVHGQSEIYLEIHISKPMLDSIRTWYLLDAVPAKGWYLLERRASYQVMSVIYQVPVIVGVCTKQG